jgi:hypothetical protein
MRPGSVSVGDRRWSLRTTRGALRGTSRCAAFGRGPRLARTPRRGGFALILVLVTIAMVSLAAYTMSDRLVVENESAQLAGRQLQARMAVDSGVAHVLYLLEQPVPTRLEWGGIYTNPQVFQAQLVVDHPEPRGRVRFGVVAPQLDDAGLPSGWRWGLEDESSRVNINALELQEMAGLASAALGELGSASSAIAQGSAALSAAADAAGGSGGAPTGAGGGGTNPGASNAGGASGTGTTRPGNGNTGGAAAPRGSTSNAPSSGAASGAPAGDSSGGSSDSPADGEAATIDTSGRGLLMKLPGMTEEVADAILDWIDEDDEPREYGAEIDYYASMQPAYAPRNGPLETIEELLLVRGVTPELLFGRDANRNGMLDVAEQNLPVSPADDGSGAMDLGWASMLTVYSQERNVNFQGQRRVNLNGEDLQQVYDDLVAAGISADWATFIIAYRLFGPFEGTSTNTITAASVQLDMTGTPATDLTQVLDLIGVRVQVPPSQAGGRAGVLESPFPSSIVAMGSYLPQLMDLCTVRAEKVFAGRVNINQASRTVLMTIPGMTTEIADAIISQREVQGAESSQEMANETWILARGIVTLDELRQMQPFITARGDVYRAQVVGYSDQGEIASRVEAVFDASSAVPRLLSWRDMSHLGRGFAREILGVSGMSAAGGTTGNAMGSATGTVNP